MGLLRAVSVLIATLVVLTIVLIVSFVFVGLCRMTDYARKFDAVRGPRCKISDLYPVLKTGDLVLFVTTTHSLHNSALTQTFYSHAGVLLREGELVYVTESTADAMLMPDPDRPGHDIRMNCGADLTPLLTRLKYYTGDYYVLRLTRDGQPAELDPAREETLKRLVEHLCREKYPYPSTTQGILGLLGRKTASRHCFQHVAHLLDAAGLTPLGRDAPLEDAGFTGVCGEVSEIPGVPLPDGYRYDRPIQIIYYIGAREFAF